RGVRAPPGSPRGIRAAHRRWLCRVRSHHPARPVHRLSHRRGARAPHRRGARRHVLPRAAYGAVLPRGGATHRPPLPRRRASQLPRAARGGSLTVAIWGAEAMGLFFVVTSLGLEPPWSGGVFVAVSGAPPPPVPPPPARFGL